MGAPAEATEFAERLYAWLVEMDPATLTDASLGACRLGLVELTRLGSELSGMLEPASEDRDDVLLWSAFQAVLHELPEADLVGPTLLDWLSLRERVSPQYEAFALALKGAGGRARHLHPTNFLRSAVHLLSGLAIVAAFQFVFTPRSAFWVALVFAGWAWSLEGARRLSPAVNRVCMVFFGPIARDHERYRVNSATWYGTALLVLAVTAFGPGGVLGLLALAVGDPMAGLVGRRFGRTQIWGGKSAEGSLAFAISAAAVGWAYLLVAPGIEGGPVGLALLALWCGGVGAIVELLSTRLEDNFTIPVLTAWAAQLGMTLL